ncbi:MAG: L-threonylcarbamoyladenylate synthase [Ekhidna sp.]
MAEIGTDIEKAEQLLRADGVIGIPTETVYGLAGNALNEEAILKIYQVKNRPKFDPLIAHTDSLEKIRVLVKSVPSTALALSEKFWPGPLTLLLDKKPYVPDLLTSGHPRLAVRIPHHTVTLELLSRLDFPLAAPSANPFGYVSPTTAEHVKKQLGDKIDYVLDGGACAVGLESTIVGFEDEKPIIYRLGGIPVELIEKEIGSVEVKINVSSDPSAPGMLKSHYSPGRKILLGDIRENLKGRDISRVGVISFQKHYDVPSNQLFVLSPGGNLAEAARNIFAALRHMDQDGIEEILSEYVPDEGLGRAINDRLRRAAV